MTGRRVDPTKRVTTTCPTCGKAFEYWRSWPRTFCSHACSGKARVSNIKRWAPSTFTASCESCGEPFTTTPKRTRGRFCSRKCWGQWSSTNVVGEAHPRSGKKGQPAWNKKPPIDVTCRVCGTTFKDTPVHGARRLTCSKACGGIWRAQTTAGENNPLWNGGHLKYYGPTWLPAQRAARKRDKVCQDCGASPAEVGRALDVHHLVSFRSFGLERHAEANRLENLVSLCQTCHTAREWATNRRHGAT